MNGLERNKTVSLNTTKFLKLMQLKSDLSFTQHGHTSGHMMLQSSTQTTLMDADLLCICVFRLWLLCFRVSTCV